MSRLSLDKMIEDSDGKSQQEGPYARADDIP